MRTRQKLYCDYGFKENEADELKDYIRGKDFADDELLKQSCIESLDCISGLLYRSLKEHIGYYKLEETEYIPLGPDDFYGYQRKALYLFRGKMIAEGKYKRD